MNMDPNQNNRPQNGNDKRPKPSIWVALAIAIVVVLLFGTIYNTVSESQYTKTSFTEFWNAKQNHNLSEVELRDHLQHGQREPVHQDQLHGVLERKAEPQPQRGGDPTGSDHLHDQGGSR